VWIWVIGMRMREVEVCGAHACVCPEWPPIPAVAIAPCWLHGYLHSCAFWSLFPIQCWLSEKWPYIVLFLIHFNVIVTEWLQLLHCWWVFYMYWPVTYCEADVLMFLLMMIPLVLCWYYSCSLLLLMMLFCIGVILMMMYIQFVILLSDIAIVFIDIAIATHANVLYHYSVIDYHLICYWLVVFLAHLFGTDDMTCFDLLLTNAIY